MMRLKKGHCFYTKMNRYQKKQFAKACKSDGTPIKFLLNEKYANFTNFITFAFDWEKTPQGLNYWYSVYVNSLNLP